MIYSEPLGSISWIPIPKHLSLLVNHLDHGDDETQKQNNLQVSLKLILAVVMQDCVYSLSIKIIKQQYYCSQFKFNE